MLVALCSVHAGGTVSSPAPELGGYLAAATAGQWLTFARPGAQVRRDGGGGSEGRVEDRAGTGWLSGQRDRRGRAGRGRQTPEI